MIFFHRETTARSAVRPTTTNPAITGNSGNLMVFSTHDKDKDEQWDYLTLSWLQQNCANNVWTDLLLWHWSSSCVLHRWQSLLCTGTCPHASFFLRCWWLAGLYGHHWSQWSHLLVDPLHFHLVSTTRMRLVDWQRYYTAGQARTLPLLLPPLTQRAVGHLKRNVRWFTDNWIDNRDFSPDKIMTAFMSSYFKLRWDVVNMLAYLLFNLKHFRA